MCHVCVACKITVLNIDLTTNLQFDLIQFLEENRKLLGSYSLDTDKITELIGVTANVPVKISVVQSARDNTSTLLLRASRKQTRTRYT